MTKKELSIAVTRLGAVLLKRIYGRGPARLTVSITRNVMVVHILDFRSPIDLYAKGDPGLRASLHQQVMNSVMSWVANFLYQVEFPVQLKDWHFDVDLDTGCQILVMIFTDEIRPEEIDERGWARFTHEMLRKLRRAHRGGPAIDERVS